MSKNCETVYFEGSGSQNTDETLRLAKKRAEELGIKDVIVASTSGATGVEASDVFKGYNLVVVSHVAGFKEPNTQSFTNENRDIVKRNGGKIVTAAHSFGSLGRAVHRKYGAIQVDEVVANVLRFFGQGTKVVCEIACMAVDAGLIRTDHEVIGIGGSGRGADTAIVLKPSNTHTLFDTKIKEIICKPRL